MTRPMPEPPECTCMSRGYGCPICLDAIGWDPEVNCPNCPVHAEPSRRVDKRLTDTECADELESAFTDFLRALPCISDMLRARERLRTWERFAARPHAFDAT